jgi:hypothetical protein
MMPKFRRVLAVVVLGVGMLVSTTALAGPNDFDLSGFATFEPNPDPDNNNSITACDNICGRADANEEKFQDFATDAGQVFAPRIAAPAETLGEAGFAINLMTSFSFIPSDEQYWQDVVEDGAPPGTLLTAHLQVRKGLPFSFEFAGDMMYLAGSEMFNLGTQLKWALNEGFYYFPDIAVRGSVNTLMGNEDLNLLNAGWDVSVSKAFDIGGVMSLAPYVGYQQLHVFASSRLLSAYPQDPRPPQFDNDNVNGDGDPNTTFAPEYVFSQYHTAVNRFFIGTRLNVWIMSITLEGVLAESVNQFTVSAGVDF